MTDALLVLALGLILVAAELFTNDVEWLGRRFSLGEGAVGSVLTAVGTALPETLVPIIAIVFASVAVGGEAFPASPPTATPSPTDSGLL